MDIPSLEPWLRLLGGPLLKGQEIETVSTENLGLEIIGGPTTSNGIPKLMLECTRAEALNPEVVSEYFCLLDKTLTELGLKNKPRQILNRDETFLPLHCNKEKAATCKGAKNTYCQSYETSEPITLLCCASAAGIPHPPMIIYSKSFPGGHYRFDGPEDALCEERVWMDRYLPLFSMVEENFLRFSKASY